MNFQNVNPLNVRINMLSGNLFPMTTDNARFPIGWKIYSAVIWLLTSVIIVAFLFGFMIVSKTKAISDGMIGTVFVVEVFFMVAHIHTHRDLVVQLIRSMNGILRVQDEIMRHVVMSSLKLMHSPFKFYWMSGVTTVIIWITMPLTAIFRKSSFVYENYRLPFAISKQPFSMEIFLAGSLLLVLCSVYVIIKKAAVDIYMLNFVMLMTAQYRYVAIKLERVFQENSWDEHNSLKENYLRTDLWAKTEIKAICRHYTIVIQ
ncbi:PREDICTED: uncharacterized protein LOC105462599 [Wasmannia auropunctata]|uniref:uncharacterized protein LOC105462599 n=1 Tax=Wasmannia auropunctata TaxID=64793 RepID=UPI0005EEF15E|nr:PREDICTED: uncharacterized protein LOC105462599 [Wasmannia auropunctata]